MAIYWIVVITIGGIGFVIVLHGIRDKEWWDVLKGIFALFTFLLGVTFHSPVIDFFAISKQTDKDGVSKTMPTISIEENNNQKTLSKSEDKTTTTTPRTFAPSPTTEPLPMTDVPQPQTNRYRVFSVDNISTWEEARTYCEQQGGYLATITSADENSLVFELMREEGYESAYFGLYKSDSGEWRWVTGEHFGYNNWAQDEPNNEGSREKYGMFYHKYRDGTWNDGDFGGRTNKGGTVFICEWD